VIRRLVETRPPAAPRSARGIDPDRGAPRGAPSATPYPVARAFAYCERIARGHDENFPVASLFVPARLRPYVWSIYAFARSADDFADEMRYVGRRAEALAYWETALHRCFHGEAEHPVFIALRETIERCAIPIQPLQALLTAFTMDLSQDRYATFEQLQTYCSYAAHPVGRLVLYIFDYRDPALHRYADDLSTALLLANFWQDVGIDLAHDRIYIPEEDRRHFGVSDEMLLDRRCTPQFRALMRYEVARTRALLERGRPLVDKVGSDLAFELAMIWRGGSAILDRIDAVGYDVLRRRPTLAATDKARMVAFAAVQRLRRRLAATRGLGG
jgi:squalene synthase HpnC